MEVAEEYGRTSETRYFNLFNYPIVKECPMIDENMKALTYGIASKGCHLYSEDFDKLCKFIKLSMDEKYGPMWHVTAGEMYGAKLDHDPGMLMQLTYGMGGKYTINIWRA